MPVINANQASASRNFQTFMRVNSCDFDGKNQPQKAKKTIMKKQIKFPQPLDSLEDTAKIKLEDAISNQ